MVFFNKNILFKNLFLARGFILDNTNFYFGLEEKDTNLPGTHIKLIRSFIATSSFCFWLIFSTLSSRSGVKCVQPHSCLYISSPAEAPVVNNITPFQNPRTQTRFSFKFDSLSIDQYNFEYINFCLYFFKTCIYIYIYMCVCVCVCLSVCLSVCLCIYALYIYNIYLFCLTCTLLLFSSFAGIF